MLWLIMMKIYLMMTKRSRKMLSLSSLLPQHPILLQISMPYQRQRYWSIKHNSWQWIQCLVWITRLILLTFTLLVTTLSFATNKPSLPRFVVTKSNEINARTGPGVRYPTDWILIKKGEPLEVIAEFEQWRYIRDITGDVGWVHSSVLSGKRAVIILGNKIQALYKSMDIASRIIVKLEPNIRCQLKSCKTDWCKLRCDGYTGWIEQKYLWGVRAGEIL